MVGIMTNNEKVFGNDALDFLLLYPFIIIKTHGMNSLLEEIAFVKEFVDETTITSNDVF